ncbi:MAG: GntR family transcriptional regulator [Microbacteriaceae bacterium]
MVAEREGRSLIEQVYLSLRERIVLGEFDPGERLHLASLASQFEVSLGVVREAVTRLASEELVVSNPQHGFRVRPLSIPDLLDLTWNRCEVETLALRRSIENGTLEWESEVVAAHHVLSATPSAGGDRKTSPDWMRAHSRFHSALTSACGSPILMRIRQELFDGSEIYRSWSDPRQGTRRRNVPNEHKGIVDAALARDADTATRRLRAHIEETTKLLIASQQARMKKGAGARERAS